MPLDSALSDVSFGDPKLVRPLIDLEKRINDQGSVTIDFKVRLLDKNKDYVKLKDGSVLVNGRKLGIVYEDSAPYYRLLSSDTSLMHAGQKMTVTIILGDGSEHPIYVTAPPRDLNQITAPDSASKSNNIVITWQEVDKTYPQTLKMVRYYVTPSGYNRSDSHEYPIETPGKGRYFVYASLLQEVEGIYKVILTLISANYGKIPDEFRSGGYIYARFMISKIVKIY